MRYDDLHRPVLVDLYVRLSRNPDGELEKIERQLEDCRRVAERKRLDGRR